MSDDPTRPRLRRPLLWCGLAVALLGIVFNLGLFFVPLDVWLEDPGLVPMPEVLVGWWALTVGLVMMVWSQLGRARR
ncbi:hypothetical protein SAMN05443287_102387 [Micromonospora phaseoli]|uniref:Uncharacterized protein n=1 Tax=Micromonospora phaseoli TaxID=1144548 RepID=A0A1H6UTF1_9ACTN|nr:hypothetical protein [Micromonospora phaseoli]PZV99151.1 hypothetical protein CLV64_104388 [Micromonospora phaseoli]GIJ78647.1 hypothetical protein Xph01_30790 [Micromonospora phaseoli]SEI95629.1 hypothetical protein SAMN05443287_102387 [Micromonospora phaseoli]